MNATSATGFRKTTQMAEVAELPGDILGIIFSKLTYDDRVRNMGVCRQWRDCGCETTSKSIIWQLKYEALRSAPIDDDEGEEGQKGEQLPAHIRPHHESRLAFIRRRRSRLKMISIGNIPADDRIVKGILGAMGVCDKLLALHLEVRGVCTNMPSIVPEVPVLLPSNLSYVWTNLPGGCVSAASVDCVRHANLEANLFADIQGSVFSLLTALTLHHVHPAAVTNVAWQHLPAIRMLDLRFDMPRNYRMSDDAEVVRDLLDNILPSLDAIEKLCLYLPVLETPILQLSGCTKLKSISLSCERCMAEIYQLLYWPQLENLFVGTVQWSDFVIGMEDYGLRRKKIYLKRLVIKHFDGLITIDRESLVGRYASLQHLELGCEEIEIAMVEERQALELLEGQSCNLILRTHSKVAERFEEDSLLSLGFRSISSSQSSQGPPHMCRMQYELIMQYGAPEQVSPPSILPSVYDPFSHDHSTSFAMDSEEFALLTSKEYKVSLEATPCLTC